MRSILLLRAALVTAGGHFVMQRKMLLGIKARAEAEPVHPPRDS